jgi:hypothetical protein
VSVTNGNKAKRKATTGKPQKETASTGRKKVRCPHCGRTSPARRAELHLRWCPAVGQPHDKHPVGAQPRAVAKPPPTAVKPRPVPPTDNHTICVKCGCVLRLANVQAHKQRCPKRHTASSSDIPPPKGPESERRPSPPFVVERVPVRSGPRFARAYSVGADGTVNVHASRDATAVADPTVGRLRCEGTEVGQEAGLGDDVRDATRYSGHSFRDERGTFGSHPVHDAFDDDSDPA